MSCDNLRRLENKTNGVNKVTLSMATPTSTSEKSEIEFTPAEKIANSLQETGKLNEELF